jgi:hypothetical protein
MAVLHHAQYHLAEHELEQAQQEADHAMAVLGHAQRMHGKR